MDRWSACAERASRISARRAAATSSSISTSRSRARSRRNRRRSTNSCTISRAEFVPIGIGAFLVRATWSEAVAGDSVELVLDPGMAFGTGLHPTTQQCLEALSTLPLEGRSALDVGTGSGILAIAAAKRGASPVVAVDTDTLAVDAARENAVRNGVAIPVGEGSAADVPGRFDVVSANIVSPVVQRIAPDLAARLSGGGTLLVAGI